MSGIFTENSKNPNVRKSGAAKVTVTDPFTGKQREIQVPYKKIPFVGKLAARSFKNSTTILQPESFKKFTIDAETKRENQRAANAQSQSSARSNAIGTFPSKSSTFATPKDFKFNLPPHSWSLPIRPSDINIVDSNATRTPTIESFHGLRRGRIWRYQGLNYEVTEGNTGTKSNVKSLDVDKWGFQFLWNPDSVQVSVSLNMEVVPSANDIFRTVLGVFPGLESISVTIVLDRTNDFACFKAVSEEALSSYSKYYLNRFPGAEKEDVTTQIKDLSKLGTGADLEYLFKTLNGAGTNTKEWANLLGKKTADIGFIQPALIAMQLGPTIDALSYVGWVNSLAVTHTAFTETMIPIRTQVNFSMNAVTGSAIE
jgi:hypothetical protein